MADVQKELQKLKALINQRPTTAFFSNKSNESDKVANGDAEFYINDMSKKFVFTRAGITNPISIDPKNKSIENLEYINDTKVADLTNNVQSITELRERVNIHETRVSELEGDMDVCESDIANLETLTANHTVRILGLETSDADKENRIKNISNDISSIKSTNIDQNARIIRLEQAGGHDDLVVKNTARFGEQPETLLFNFLDHDFWYIEPRWSFGDHTRLSMLIKRLFEITTDHIIYISFDVDFNGQICTWTASYDFSKHDEMPYSVDIHCSTNTIYPTEIRFTHGAGQLTSRYEIDVFNIPKYSGTYPVVMKELRVCTHKEKKYNVEISKEGNITVGGNLTVNGSVDINNAKRLTMKGFGSDGYGPIADIGFIRFCNGKSDGNIAYLRWASSNSNLITFTPALVKVHQKLEATGGISCPNNVMPITVGGTTIMEVKNTNVYIANDITMAGGITAGNTILTPRLRLSSWADSTKQWQIYVDGNMNLIACNLVKGSYHTLFGGSQTITHNTNLTGELGTFCEANGTIYDGYEKISNTDCICAVNKATLLNKKIVGIICGESEFASHGDVLVKIAPGTVAEVGDILCPDERGYGRVATEDELIFMMMYAIPRPKITCLDTGIDGYVACFIV